MASFNMIINPQTTIRDISHKIEAFKVLYGDDVAVVARGFCIETGAKKDCLVFPLGDIDVVSIGKRYLKVRFAFSVSGNELQMVDMQNPNHGITELIFITSGQA